MFFFALFLVPCGLGMFHNATDNTCIDCPPGTYNDLQASDQCKTCPLGTSTLKSQSDSCTSEFL